MFTPFIVGGLVCAVAVLILCTVKIKLHPFFALIATTEKMAKSILKITGEKHASSPCWPVRRAA